MGIVTIGLLMISGACIVLGASRISLWLNERRRYDYLVVATVCFGLAAYSFFEFKLAQATDPAEYLQLIRWSHIAAGMALVGVATFVYMNLGGRPWLFWPAIGLRLLAIFLNFFVFPTGINFLEITSIGRVEFLGEMVSYPIGIQNPWMVLSQGAHLLIIVLCIDASVRLWLKGERRAAITVGTTTALFAVTSLGFAVAVLWGLVRAPMLSTPSILFIMAGLWAELNVRMRQTTKRVIEQERELTERLEQLNLSANAASVGLWRRDMETGEFWASDKLKEIYGFSAEDEMTVDKLNDRIHPTDRERVRLARRQAQVGGGEYQIEYRIQLPDGRIRWIFTRGRADEGEGTPRMKRGAAVDITQRKSAESTVHELSGKLINAQEEERGRIARELHDDLSQRIALTSILLEEVRGADDASRFVKNKLADIIAQILTLATDMHRLSHELHPAKINQLGLEPALRSYCRDLQAAYPIKIEFESNEVPLHIPDDISLCLYRVAQEALQNVVRHSGSDSAQVSIGVDETALRLIVHDDGCGFDKNEITKKNSLGLISIDERMRSVQGEARIQSAPGVGTTVEARVSLNGEAKGRNP